MPTQITTLVRAHFDLWHTFVKSSSSTTCLIKLSNAYSLSNAKLFIESLNKHIEKPMVAIDAKALFQYYEEEKDSDAWTSPTEYH